MICVVHIYISDKNPRHGIVNYVTEAVCDPVGITFAQVKCRGRVSEDMSEFTFIIAQFYLLPRLDYADA